MFKLNLLLKLAAAVLLALPAALASATPIFVEYDTHIADCTFCAGTEFLPGDRVSGWLKIDTDRAPPDRFSGQGDPGSQIHAQYWKPDGPDFISGRGWQATGWGQDQVTVIDDSGPFRFQGYSILDYSNNKQGGGGTILDLQL